MINNAAAEPTNQTAYEKTTKLMLIITTDTTVTAIGRHRSKWCD
ncbi:MAG: hypothetical protein WBD20_08035 [Pirellulaceae bacterium]